MRKIKYFSSFLPLLLVFVLCSSTVLAKDNWIRVNSKNFHLIGNASEKDIRKAATKLEQFHETFRLLFRSANFKSSIPTNVIVFKSGSAYKPFKPKRADGKTDNFIAGYFLSGRDVNYITLSMEGEDAETFGTIFHEYVHYLVDINFGKSDIPPWFNEGLAEYYQTFEIEEDQKVKLGLPQNNHLELLQQSQLIPLQTLLQIDNYSLKQNGNHSRSVFYAQSWALIHYLIQGSKGAKNEGLNKFLSLVLKDVPLEKAFQDSFQMTFAEMEKELKKYIGQRTYQYQLFTFNKKLVFDNEMQVSALPEPDANSYLGDLLFHLQRYDEAEQILQKALAIDQNSSMANTTLGMVKFRQRKFEEAKKYLEKAVTDDQKNHFALYNYAYLLSRENQDEFGFVKAFSAETAGKMRNILKKAIAVNPAHTDSYELLAYVNLVNNENLDEAVEFLKKALTYQPGDQQTVLRIAEIYFRQEKIDEARQLAEKISKTTDETEIKARADNLLSNIQTIQNIKAQNEAMRKQYEQRRNEVAKNGNQTVLTRRQGREKTPEEIAKEEEITKILSINQALKKPTENEKQIIGRITKVACIPKTIVYTVKTETGTVSLFSRDFQNLALVSFDSGAENVQLGCNANLTAFKSVLTYKPAKSNYAGELIAIDFVPEYFRFMEASDEVAIIENPTSQTSKTDTPSFPSQTDETAKRERPTLSQNGDVETQRREAMWRAIKSALRPVQEGETRVVGMIERVECDKNGMFFVMKTETQLLKLKSPQTLQLRAFVPDVAGTQFQCGMKQFDANAVITYKPSDDKKTKSNGDLVALEFVPNTFKLE